MARIKFCGTIEGSVQPLKGETPQQAIARAENMLLGIMRRYAKSLSFDDDAERLGPNIGLEINETANQD